jgi:hypothetical protein
MTRGATPADCCLRALRRQVGIVVRLFARRRRQRGEIGAEPADILVADVLRDRLHLVILARAAAEEHQLPLNELIHLPGQRWNVLGLRNAVFAMTAGADFGLLLYGRGVGSVSRCNARQPDSGSQQRKKFEMAAHDRASCSSAGRSFNIGALSGLAKSPYGVAKSPKSVGPRLPVKAAAAPLCSVLTCCS